MAGRRVRHAVAVLMGSALLSGCWLQPGFDGSQTRWNPLENRLTAANVAHLAELMVGRHLGPGPLRAARPRRAGLRRPAGLAVDGRRRAGPGRSDGRDGMGPGHHPGRGRARLSPDLRRG